MSSLFSIDSPLWRALTKVADLVWLNILFVICCIPIFTIGAALTAMYNVTFKMCMDEDGAISQDFFKAFRENFKQATVLWLIMLGLALFIIADFLLIPLFGGIVYDVAFAILCIIGILYIMVFSYLFPLHSRFDNTTKNTLMNALFISIRHAFPTTLSVAALTSIPGLVVYFKTELLLNYLSIVILIVFSGIAFLNTKLLNPVFAKYITPQEQISTPPLEEAE